MAAWGSAGERHRPFKRNGIHLVRCREENELDQENGSNLLQKKKKCLKSFKVNG